jgi:ribosome biogenesis GTPase
LSVRLTRLGWTPSLESEFEPHAAAGCIPARVGAQHRGAYVVLLESGERPAEPSGGLRHRAGGRGELPVVGDWVALRHDPVADVATIVAVLPRRTAFSRKAAGEETVEQVLAANVDTLFLVSAIGPELNPRRIERYLIAAWESGAQPVVVLNKSDLSDDPAAAAAEMEEVALGVSVHVVSCATGAGLEELSGYLKGNRTVALLGSSGVGKTSLANRLVGGQARPTQDVRADGRGRHTTTNRELILVPGGGLLLDSPGMRALGLWRSDAGVDGAFEEVATLARRCRFRDCAHEHEPGCAVLAAVADGRLEAARFESFRKLRRELVHLELKHDDRRRAELRQERRRFARSQRRTSWQ